MKYDILVCAAISVLKLRVGARNSGGTSVQTLPGEDWGLSSIHPRRGCPLDTLAKGVL